MWEETSMTIGQHAEMFAGFRVEDYDPDAGAPAGQAERWVINRLGIAYEEAQRGLTMAALLERFLADPAAAEAPGLVIGSWGGDDMVEPNGAAKVVNALVAARDQLPSLRALFLGDIICEECEISWINLADVSPLLRAYPALE